jgi:hypothetical protein
MEKLSELLRKSFPAKPESNHPKNRADILMRKDEILEAAAQGWPFTRGVKSFIIAFPMPGPLPDLVES